MGIVNMCMQDGAATHMYLVMRYRNVCTNLQLQPLEDSVILTFWGLLARLLSYQRFKGGLISCFHDSRSELVIIPVSNAESFDMGINADFTLCH